MMRSRMMIGSLVSGWLACAAMLPGAGAAETASPWKGGADLRVRQEYFNDIPVPGRLGEETHYFRIRPRAWAQYLPSEDVTVSARIVNEFRFIDTFGYDFPSEVLVDQLYLDWRNLLDGALDLRIGRQDLIYGTGKVLLEGTPKDGSRTIYFDAARITVRPGGGGSLDILGIYNQPTANLAVGPNRERDVTGRRRGNNNLTEAGGGLYYRSKAFDQTPFEAYYLYKNDSAWSYVGPEDARLEVPAKQLHTAGLRLMPSTGPFRANLELAGQTGSSAGGEEHRGMMFDGRLAWTPDETGPFTLGLGYYYLSGNNPETAQNEAWDPLWGCWPQYSELYLYAFAPDGVGRWSNLSMPRLDIEYRFTAQWKAQASAAWMGAHRPVVAGGDTDRGWLYTLKTEGCLGRGLLMRQDRLNAHALVEVLTPGAFHAGAAEQAYFARWELLYSF